MALVMMSGFPCSGKTTRAQQLKTAFEQHKNFIENNRIQHIVLINDESLNITKDLYKESKTERSARAALISAIERALAADTIVIADALNYIKGFRYQLFCLAKAASLPSCIIQVGTPENICESWNTQRQMQKYPNGLIHELVMRYEEPNPMNRWDSPTFTVIFSDEAPPANQIWEALINHRPVKPNLATVVKPSEGSDYLAQLEKCTQEICSLISEQIALNNTGSLIKVDSVEQPLQLPTEFVSHAQLQRMRRQFLALMRATPLTNIKTAFVAFLNTQWSS